MKELIKVTTNAEGKKLVSARELYKGLGLARTKWTPWYTKNIIQNEYFKENEDWLGVSLEVTGNTTKDFAISLEFAKHLAMMSRTEKSHEYRNYFIECEKIALEIQQPKLPRTFKEALLELVATIEKNEPCEFFSEYRDKEYKDYMGYRKYFDNWVLRGLKNLLAGTKDFNIMLDEEQEYGECI